MDSLAQRWKNTQKIINLGSVSRFQIQMSRVNILLTVLHWR